MGMRITITVKSGDKDSIVDLIRSIIKDRTGEEPVIHTQGTPSDAK